MIRLQLMYNSYTILNNFFLKKKINHWIRRYSHVENKPND